MQLKIFKHQNLYAYQQIIIYNNEMTVTSLFDVVEHTPWVFTI